MALKPIRTVKPGVDLIEVKTARRHCNVDDSDSDDVLAAIVGSVTDYLEAPAGILRVCLLKQTWQQFYSCFPDDEIRLPVEPLLEVVSVEYIAAGATTWSTLSSDAWESFSDELGGGILPIDGTSWPDTANRVQAVRVTFTAGFGTKVGDVPGNITHAAKLLLGHLFENREATLVGVVATELPLGVQALLRPWFRIPV